MEPGLAALLPAALLGALCALALAALIGLRLCCGSSPDPHDRDRGVARL